VLLPGRAELPAARERDPPSAGLLTRSPRLPNVRRAIVPSLSDPLKKKLRKKAKKAKRRELEKAIERNGHHAREKKKRKR
jgi:hypothetical protein